MSKEEDIRKLPSLQRSKTNVNELQNIVMSRKESESLRDVWFSAKCRREEFAQQQVIETYKKIKFQKPVRPWQSSNEWQFPQNGQPLRISLKRISAEEDSNLKPERYYSPLTRRSQPLPPKFDALVRTYVPVPHLYEGKPPSQLYGTQSLDSWKKQVVKVVPPRPQFSVPAKGGEMRSWAVEVSDDFQITCRPQFHLASKTPIKRHFFVSPEWISEDVVHRTGKAYRSNIVFG